MSEDAAPRARLTGAVYILYFLSAAPLALRDAMIVPGDASATMAHVAAAAPLYRLTLASDLLSYALYIALTWLLWDIARRTSHAWASIAALLSLAGCAILIVATAALLVPLLLGGDRLPALGESERAALSMLAIQLYREAYRIALLFFGSFCLILGSLLAVSRRVPRPIGWLLAGAGAGWIAFSLAGLLALPPTTALGRIVVPIGAIAEIALGLWLLLRGTRPLPEANV